MEVGTVSLAAVVIAALKSHKALRTMPGHKGRPQDPLMKTPLWHWGHITGFSLLPPLVGLCGFDQLT